MSVFNDDKKTDLIGETWVPLDKVVIPGGGQNDLWHNLNCKGRYAGDIRIELTYYDTRAKEEKSAEPQGSPSTGGSQERGSDTVGGPRQLKQFKRRPLPADPVSASPSPHRPIMPEHSQSSPLPYTPTRSIPQPQDTPQHNTPLSASLNDQSPYSSYEAQGSPAPSQYLHDPYKSQVQEYPQETSFHEYSEQIHPTSNDNYGAGIINQSQSQTRNRSYPQNGLLDHPDPQASPLNHQQQSYQDYDLPQLPPYESRCSRPPPQSVVTRDTYGGSHSSPASTFPQYRPPQDTYQQRQGSPDEMRLRGSAATRNGYDSSPLRNQSFGEDHHSTPQLSQSIEDDDSGPPPPPPAHRSSGLRSLPQRNEYESMNPYSQDAAPAPLNIRQNSANSGPSPVPQRYNDMNSGELMLATSPSNAQVSMHSVPSFSSNTSHTQTGRRQSYGPVLLSSDDRYGQQTPPSLVAGYDPRIVEEESERMDHENRISSRSDQTLGAAQSYDSVPKYDSLIRRSPIPQYDSFSTVNLPQSYSQNTRPHRASVPTTPEGYSQAITKHRASVPTAHNSHSQVITRHRASAPMVKPRAISPDPRIPMRKSLSPQPESHSESKVSPIPFGPDSYEEFNPNLRLAKSINKLGPTYNTPEEIKDAALDREREEKLEEGPIIGTDGRVIDPSDHLPVENWAPEYERKPIPRKGPEITFRFRQSPQGAQPMPNSSPRPPRETVIRPHSIATTAHSYSADNVSSSTIAVKSNRLQKKSHVSIIHPTSSPAVPTLNHHDYDFASAHSPSYPLREHVNVNYGHNGISPSSHGRNAGGSPISPISPAAAPPPIPAKIPVHRGQEEWDSSGSNALSEEMKRIDIGVGSGYGTGTGSGGRRGFRGRFG